MDKYDLNDIPAGARNGVLARKRALIEHNLLPRLATQPREAWTPELIGELAAVLQSVVPDGMTVALQQRPVDAHGHMYDATLVDQ